MSVVIRLAAFFSAAIVIEMCQLLASSMRRTAFHNRRGMQVLAFLFRCISFAGLALATLPAKQLHPLSGRLLWVILAIAIAMYYLIPLLEGIDGAMRRFWPAAYCRPSMDAWLIVTVLAGTATVMQVSRLYAIVVLAALVVSRFELLAPPAEALDYGGAAVGLVWVALTPNVLKSVGNAMRQL